MEPTTDRRIARRKLARLRRRLRLLLSAELEPNTTEMRIVSKWEYVRTIGGKSVYWTGGKVFDIIGLGCFLVALVSAFFIVLFTFLGEDYISGTFMGKYCPSGRDITMALLVSIFVGYFTYRASLNASERVASMPRVVPLTRANTADLPAPNTLVRASSEPLQAQQAVLLRAATEEALMPPEELVRPAGEPKQV